MTSDPAPFMIAQALHILAETGHPEPEKQTAGLTFVAHMLQAGYRRTSVIEAIQAWQTAAKAGCTWSTHLTSASFSRNSYTLAFLEAIRPDIIRRTIQSKPAYSPEPDKTLDIILMADVRKALNSAQEAANAARTRADGRKSAATA